MMARSVRIGLVVDCTALDLEEFEPLPAAKAAAASKFDRRVRYFHNPSEWDDFDAEYHRLLPPQAAASDGSDGDAGGGGQPPPLAPRALPEFYRTVSDFLRRSRAASSSSSGGDGKVCVALFDARGGLGAAAYLAAAYMCHALRAPVHAAVEAVKEGTPAQTGEDAGRKWGLCDVRLVKDLQRRFKGRREIRMEGGTPRWWWAVGEEDDGDSDDDGNQQEEGGESTSKRKREREEAIVIPPCDSPTETEDRSKRVRTGNGTVPSPNNSLYPILPKEILEPVPKESPKWSRALTILAQMTTTPSSSSPDPTLMTKLPLKPEVHISGRDTESNLLQIIKSNPDQYKVTWLSTKSRRGLLLILAEAVYFLEELTSQITISVVANIKFPSRTDLTKPQHRTLLDVVLVKDIERNKPTFRFYALDILCIEGGTVWHKTWDQRWPFLNEGVLMPRKKDESQGSSHSYAREPIKIRSKEYFPMRKAGFVMKDVCIGVGHAAEGVRVVPVGKYGIGGGEGKEGTMAVVWKRGGGLSDEKLRSLLLAD